LHGGIFFGKLIIAQPIKKFLKESEGSLSCTFNVAQEFKFTTLHCMEIAVTQLTGTNASTDEWKTGS
jgi:hypothetical protein